MNNAKTMDLNTGILMTIMRRFPFKFKEYMILEHEEKNADIGFESFWLSIKENIFEDNLDKYIVSKEKPEHQEGWRYLFFPKMFIGYLTDWPSGEVITNEQFSYNAIFKYIFKEFKNEDEFETWFWISKRKLEQEQKSHFLSHKSYRPGCRLERDGFTAFVGSYFDISLTYKKGHSAIFNGLTYIFDPNEKQAQFSIGIFPTEGHGWRIA